MANNPGAVCPDCSPLDSWLWSEGAAPRLVQEPLSLTRFNRKPHYVAVIFAQANEIRDCKACRASLSTLFTIPDLWWSDYCRKGNGYFGSQDIVSEQDIATGMVSWSRFKIKQVHGNDSYNWIKVNILTQWLGANNQAVLVFDPSPSSKLQFRDALLAGLRAEELADPFWVYHRLLNEVISLQDDAIWKARDRVRTVERSSSQSKAKRPDYRRMHDLSRHAIHIVETVTVTKETIQRIITQHTSFAAGVKDATETRQSITKRIHDRLLFFEHIASSFQHRAVATKERLANEIQLSFNTVTQQDAATTIEISRIAQIDSAAMKAIAFLTLTFLPATFVSAVFSTSFFNFSPELQRWSVSDKFWIFWACAIPVTVVTPVLWYRWGRALFGVVGGVDDSGSIRQQ